MKILHGYITRNFVKEGAFPVRDDCQDVVFSQPFNHPPFVHLSLEKIDEAQFPEPYPYPDKEGNSVAQVVCRVELLAQNVSTTGFIARIMTWEKHLIYGYRISWLAIED